MREVGTEVGLCESEEVPLAAPARPLGEHGEGEDLAWRQRGRPTGSARDRRMALSPPVVYEDIQRDEQGFEIYRITPPFGRRGNLRAVVHGVPSDLGTPPAPRPYLTMELG